MRGYTVGRPIGTERDPQRRTLSRQRVLEAACAIADREGIAALTMRRIGREVGVEAMSLYSHIRNKEDLMDGLADLVAAEVRLPAGGSDWRAQVRGVALETNAALGRHGWCGFLWATRTRLGPNRAAIMNALLRGLGAAGLPAETVHRTFHVLENHIIGYALRAASFPLSAPELRAAGEEALADIDLPALPDLARHIGEHRDPRFSTPPGENEFQFGLDLILDGLDRAYR